MVEYDVNASQVVQSRAFRTLTMTLFGATMMAVGTVCISVPYALTDDLCFRRIRVMKSLNLLLHGLSLGKYLCIKERLAN